MSTLLRLLLKDRLDLLNGLLLLRVSVPQTPEDLLLSFFQLPCLYVLLSDPDYLLLDQLLLQLLH